MLSPGHPGQVIVVAAPVPLERFSSLLERAAEAAGLPSDEPFALFVAMDYSADLLEAVSAFAQGCIRRGMFSLDVWGEGSETVHDIVDLTQVVLQLDEPDASPGTVTTMWHDGRGVEDALWAFVNLAFAADGRRDGRLWLVMVDDAIAPLPIEAWFASSGLSVRLLRDL